MGINHTKWDDPPSVGEDLPPEVNDFFFMPQKKCPVDDSKLRLFRFPTKDC